MKKVFILIITVFSFVSCNDAESDTSVVYFLVGEKNPDKGQTYTLPLTDPVAIEEARTMIADPDKAKIILAEITKNPWDNYYRNKDLNNDRIWSWHVSKFLGFADFTIEIYDGWPEYVEDNYDEWVEITKGANGKGRIGFWGYTIIQEVEKSALQ